MSNTVIDILNLIYEIVSTTTLLTFFTANAATLSSISSLRGVSVSKKKIIKEKSCV